MDMLAGRGPWPLRLQRLRRPVQHQGAGTERRLLQLAARRERGRETDRPCCAPPARAPFQQPHRRAGRMEFQRPAAPAARPRPARAAEQSAGQRGIDTSPGRRAGSIASPASSTTIAPLERRHGQPTRAATWTLSVSRTRYFLPCSAHQPRRLQLSGRLHAAQLGPDTVGYEFEDENGTLRHGLPDSIRSRRSEREPSGLRVR